MHENTAIAHPNIAFIKYWGNRDNDLRLPSNGSISMSLGALETRTTVTLESNLTSDELVLDGSSQSGVALERVSTFLDIIRSASGKHKFAHIVSENSFPQSAGIASSASAFAALALAASRAFDLDLTERELSILARRGSGSAARSIPAGFAEWHMGSSSDDSFAEAIAPPDHWPLWDCIALVEDQPKKVGSTQGHQLAGTSPLQSARLQDATRRLDLCREAILKKDFAKLADVIELDSNMMHAVMLTSQPPLMYWSPLSIEIMRQVTIWRAGGLEAAYTLDAGPNVHIICTAEARQSVSDRLSEIQGVMDVIISPVGGGVFLTTR
ncbi:MAG: diphosphomevalonate decarboxylase [Chloroflexi bacterium]|nr:diphosphomevalonate decarboxylase [Chloroflexota bacterium]